MFLAYSTIMSNSWRSSVTSNGVPRRPSSSSSIRSCASPPCGLWNNFLLNSVCNSVLNLGSSNKGYVCCAHCLLLGNIAGLQKDANNVWFSTRNRLRWSICITCTSKNTLVQAQHDHIHTVMLISWKMWKIGVKGRNICKKHVPCLVLKLNLTYEHSSRLTAHWDCCVLLKLTMPSNHAACSVMSLFLGV